MACVYWLHYKTDLDGGQPIRVVGISIHVIAERPFFSQSKHSDKSRIKGEGGISLNSFKPLQRQRERGTKVKDGGI